MINIDASVKIQKNKNGNIWNPAACNCDNGKYLASTIQDSVITCDEIINAAYSVSTNVPKNVMSCASINVTSAAPIIFRNKKV